MSSQRDGDAPTGVRRPWLPRAGRTVALALVALAVPLIVALVALARSTTATTVPAATTVAPVTTVPRARSTGYPTPSTTGWSPTGVTLRPYSGPKTITANGTVIDGADIRGGLTIEADDVSITRSRITGGGGANYVVLQSSGSSDLRIEDTEVANASGEVADRAISSKGTNMTLTRVYVHGTQRGIETGRHTTVEDSYADDFDNTSGNHATGVMSLGGTDHVVLRHNAFGCGTGECSSAMSVYPQREFGGPNDDWTIDGNLFNGGGYCVYLGYSPADGESPNTNMRVTNNGFGDKYSENCGLYGPVASWSSSEGNTWTGNHWYTPSRAKNGTAVDA